jgi:hypothetical protein
MLDIWYLHETIPISYQFNEKPCSLLLLRHVGNSWPIFVQFDTVDPRIESFMQRYVLHSQYLIYFRV